MENRTLEITIQNAKDLKKVNLITKMDVYVVVSISGGGKKWRQRTKTPVDRDGDASPTWNFPMKFTVEEAALQQNRLIIDFNLVCQRALGDKDIGEVHVPIKELLDTPAKGGAAVGKKFVSYQVKKPSGKPKGQLSFSYKFSEETTTTSAAPASPPPSPPVPVEMAWGESVSAYPAVGPSLEYSPTAGWYPPDPSCPTTVAADGGGGYYPPPVRYAPDSDSTPGGFPPPHFYGYSPPPPGYGYTPPPVYGYAPPPHGYGYDPPPPPSMPDYGYTPQPEYGYPPPPGYGNPHTVRL